MADIPPNIMRANSVHEIGHAVVGAVLGMDLVRVAIVGRIRVDDSVLSLGQARFRRGTWVRRTKEHYLDLIAMTMAGMAAEEVFLGGHDDGVAGADGSDLFEATKTAIAMERSSWARSLPLTVTSAVDTMRASVTLIRRCWRGSTVFCRSSSTGRRVSSSVIEMPA
jgi:hypothetical protein